MRFHYRDKQAPYSYASSLAQAMQARALRGHRPGTICGSAAARCLHSVQPLGAWELREGTPAERPAPCRQPLAQCALPKAMLDTAYVSTPVPQVYSESDILLGAYSVPLEYDPALIEQVGRRRHGAGDAWQWRDG